VKRVFLGTEWFGFPVRFEMCVCVCVCVVSYMTHRISMRVDTCKAVPSVCVCVCETPKEDPTVNSPEEASTAPGYEYYLLTIQISNQ